LKKLAIVLLMATIVLISGCSNSTSSVDSKDSSFTGSFNELLLKSKPITCTWEINSGEVSSKGIIYVYNNKFFSSVTTNTITANSINDGTYLYIWNSLQEAGSKIKLEDVTNLSKSSSNIPEGSAQLTNLDTLYNYKCSPWTPINNKFIPPTTINFQDLSGVLKSLDSIAKKIETEGINSENTCSICSSMPSAELKKNCLASCQT